MPRFHNTTPSASRKPRPHPPTTQADAVASDSPDAPPPAWLASPLWTAYAASVEACLVDSRVRAAWDDLAALTHDPREVRSACGQALDAARAHAVRGGVGAAGLVLTVEGMLGALAHVAAARRRAVADEYLDGCSREWHASPMSLPLRTCHLRCTVSGAAGGRTRAHLSHSLPRPAVYEFFVVIACCRLDQRGRDTFNPVRVADQLAQLARSQAGKTSVPRISGEQVLGILGTLQAAGVVVPAEGGTQADTPLLASPWAPMRLVPSVARVEAALRARESDTTPILLEWLHREAVEA